MNLVKSHIASHLPGILAIPRVSPIHGDTLAIVCARPSTVTVPSVTTAKVVAPLRLPLTCSRSLVKRAERIWVVRLWMPGTIWVSTVVRDVRRLWLGVVPGMVSLRLSAADSFAMALATTERVSPVISGVAVVGFGNTLAISGAGTIRATTIRVAAR